MSESLFTAGNINTASVTQQNDGVDITTGTIVKSDVDGLVTAIRYFAPSTAETNRKMAFYRWINDTSTGGRLLTVIQSFVTTVDGDWNVTTLDLPIYMSSAEYYIPVIHATTRYVSFPAFFTSHAINNSSHLSSPADASGTKNNGRYRKDGTNVTGYPYQAGSGACYMPDIVFTPITATGDSGHTTQTPGSSSNDANSPRVLGVDFTVNTAGTIAAGKFWVAGPEHPATVECALWDPSVSTTVPVATKKIRPSYVGWHTIPFDTPPSVVSGHTYTISFHITNALTALSCDYAFTNSGLSSNIVNGHVTLLSGHARFLNNSATHAYPSGTASDNLFADVVFSAGSPPATQSRLWGIRR